MVVPYKITVNFILYLTPPSLLCRAAKHKKTRNCRGEQFLVLI